MELLLSFVLLLLYGGCSIDGRAVSFKQGIPALFEGRACAAQVYENATQILKESIGICLQWD